MCICSLVVFVEQIMRQRGVQESVDIEILGNEEVVPLVVLASARKSVRIVDTRNISLHTPAFSFSSAPPTICDIFPFNGTVSGCHEKKPFSPPERLLVGKQDLPLVSRIAVSNQPHASHLRRHQDLRTNAHQPLQPFLR